MKINKKMSSEDHAYREIIKTVDSESLLKPPEKLYSKPDRSHFDKLRKRIGLF